MILLEKKTLSYAWRWADKVAGMHSKNTIAKCIQAHMPGWIKVLRIIICSSR